MIFLDRPRFAHLIVAAPLHLFQLCHDLGMKVFEALMKIHTTAMNPSTFRGGGGKTIFSYRVEKEIARATLQKSIAHETTTKKPRA